MSKIVGGWVGRPRRRLHLWRWLNAMIRHPEHQLLSEQFDLPELLSRGELRVRRETRTASELSHWVGEVQYLFSLPRSWQSSHRVSRILRWHFIWIASSRCASHCRIGQVSGPYRHIDITQRRQSLSFIAKVRRFWDHKRLRSLIAEAAIPIQRFMSGLQNPSDAYFGPRYVNSVTLWTIFPSKLINAHPVV